MATTGSDSNTSGDQGRVARATFTSHPEERRGTAALALLWLTSAVSAYIVADQSVGRACLLAVAFAVSVPAIVGMVYLLSTRSPVAAAALACGLFGVQQWLASGDAGLRLAAWSLAVVTYLGYLRAFTLDDIVEGTLFGAVLSAVGGWVISIWPVVTQADAVRRALSQ